MRVSPVSKGRKRRPGKGGRKTGPRRERPGLSGPPLGAKAGEYGFDVTAYLGDLSPEASRAEVEDTMDRRAFTMPYYGTTIRARNSTPQIQTSVAC